jgi:cyanate permease
MATVLGSGTAPWLMGMVHDRTGSYDIAMIVAMSAFVLAAVAAWMLPEFRTSTVSPRSGPPAATQAS